MPTPVGVARQCLAEAAAAVLDDAVAVARRRSHGQTTSLHVVSALLALPSSTLREACTRARSSAYSPRLQFRAMELCVGVALDRVSVSKSAAEAPPVSNSLMAAIKRSQANQRRHPETFHLYQQQVNLNPQNSPSISAVKVELKHFMMSILDDPIVSRVFGDAGFRTHEIKLAVLNPLNRSRFSLTTTLPPPLFQCNLSDFELSKRLHNFPFPDPAPEEKSDENSRRIGKILVKTTRRNPLLIGVYAGDAYRDFTDCLMRSEPGVLPKELDGLRVLSLEHQISECISGSLSEEMIQLKFKQVDKMMEDCKEPGIVVNCGDFKTFVVESVDAVSCVVLKLKRLLINHGGKIWLIGFLGGDDVYKKLLQQFPAIEVDLDLHLLPITNSSIGGKPFQSSLMRSFVPFGGFFAMPSELDKSCTAATKPLTLCNSCNEKCEQEVSDVRKGISTDSAADKKSVNLPSWLQIGECETSKRSHSVEAKEDKTVLDARVMALQRKWSDICQRLHCSRTSQEAVALPKSYTSCVASSLNNVPTWKDAIDVGSLSNRSRLSNLSPCEPSDFQKNSLPMQCLPRAGMFTSTPSVFSVTTDLTLGSHNGSAEECRRNPNSQDHNHSSGVQNNESSRNHEISLSQASQSSPCSHRLEKQIYTKDLDHQWKVLEEKVYWQMEAIQTISQTLSSCRNGNGKHCANKGNIWFSFLGPDKVGKRKIAASVAEIVFGRKENFLYLDLNSHDVKNFNSVVDCFDSRYPKTESGRKMLVDYLAEELSKHPQSVVLLENVEKADFLIQSSLSQAVKTGKFPDSHGREINLNNNVFILASTVLKVGKDLLSSKVASEFPEETISEARNLQMQVLVRSVDGDFRRNKTTHVSISSSNVISNEHRPSGKRKSISNDFTIAEMSKRACRSPRSFIDLNLPSDDRDDDDDGGGGGDDDDDDDVWLGELLEHVHENVVFKPFDFDSLSRKIMKEIDMRLKRVVGATCLLEIDRQVMVQMLAAAWLTEKENALEDWIERVLFSTIDEASRSGSASSEIVLKLVPCDGVTVEAQARGVCLPARINVK
ncbi:hypothetical protein ACS0TY_007999 [Phlomoides rotata]